MEQIISKPILYGGYTITGGRTTINRIAHEYFTDVYKLSDGKYLYLFNRLTSNDIKNKDISLEIITVGREQYYSLVVDTYTKSRLGDLIDSLTNLRGFNAVAGMQTLKQTLRQDVIGPLHEPEKYKKFKLSIPSGILLFGPPGCGKTFIVRKLAEEIKYNFIELKHSDIASEYIHGTVQKVGRIFDMARAKAPSIIFIDEIEGLIPKRDSLGVGKEHKQEEINEFLMQLNDAGKQNVLVIAATNRPGLVDEAILRTGRMDKQIYVSPPDTEARIELFKMFLSDRPIANIDYAKLATLTNNYASVDIEYIVNEAARETLIADKDQISQSEIEEVISKTPSSISDEELTKYITFKNKQRA